MDQDPVQNTFVEEQLPQGGFIEETVDVVDNSKWRLLGALCALALVLALIGLLVYLLFVAKPKGAANTKDTNGITWIRSIYGATQGNQTRLMEAPRQCAIDQNGGKIWVNVNDFAVVVYNPNGQFDRLLQGSEVAGKVDKEAALAPRSLDITSDDELLIVNAATKDKPYLFTQEGDLLKEYGISNALDVSSTGKYVAVSTTNNELGLFTKDSSTPLFFLKTYSKGKSFNSVRGVYVDSDGNVYASDSYNGMVHKFDKSGKWLWSQGTPQSSNKDQMKAKAENAKRPFELPMGLCEDGNGRIVVADAYKYQLIALDKKTGKIEGRYGDYGPEEGLFDQPYDVDYDSNRDWFAVSDTMNNRVQIIRIPNSASAMKSFMARFNQLFDTPWWICCLPFIVLVALALLAFQRRKSVVDKQDFAENVISSDLK